MYQELTFHKWLVATASSLYEAVAQGLSALHKNEWVEGIEERFGFVKVSVADVRVEHQVKIANFMKWLERPGRTHGKSRIASESGQFSGLPRCLGVSPAAPSE